MCIYAPYYRQSWYIYTYYVNDVCIFKWGYTVFQYCHHFSAGCRNLIDTSAHIVESIQDQTQYVLSQYQTTQHVTDPLRFGHLLLILSMIREIKTDTIKQVFFSSLTGSGLPIEKILDDIYRTEALSTFWRTFHMMLFKCFSIYTQVLSYFLMI